MALVGIFGAIFLDDSLRAANSLPFSWSPFSMCTLLMLGFALSLSCSLAANGSHFALESTLAVATIPLICVAAFLAAALLATSAEVFEKHCRLAIAVSALATYVLIWRMEALAGINDADSNALYVGLIGGLIGFYLYADLNWWMDPSHTDYDDILFSSVCLLVDYVRVPVHMIVVSGWKYTEGFSWDRLFTI